MSVLFQSIARALHTPVHKGPRRDRAAKRKAPSSGDGGYVSRSTFERTRANAAHYLQIREALADNRPWFAAKTRKCGWAREPRARHAETAVGRRCPASMPPHLHAFGDCKSVKSAPYAHRFLNPRPRLHRKASISQLGQDSRPLQRRNRLDLPPHHQTNHAKWLFYAASKPAEMARPSARIQEGYQVQTAASGGTAPPHNRERSCICRDRRDVVRPFLDHTDSPTRTFFQTLVRHRPRARDRKAGRLNPSDVHRLRHAWSLLQPPVTTCRSDQNYLSPQDQPRATPAQGPAGAPWIRTRRFVATSQEGRTPCLPSPGRGRIGKRYGTRF